LTNVVLHS